MILPRHLLSLRTSLFAAMGLGLSAYGCSGVVPCDDAKPIPAKGGKPSGFETCADGTIRRVEAVAADPTIDAPACKGTEQVLQCKTDAECTAQLHGKCTTQSGVIQPGNTPFTACSCVYGCATDAECGPGQVCIPGGVDGPDSFCAVADCTRSEDCSSDLCAIKTVSSECGVGTKLACREPGDTCSGAACNSEVAPSCGIGRPLLIHGRARTAATAERGDWIAIGAAPDLADLDAATRAALGQHWLEVAALEHASVASFARFTLELLSLGAPPSLIADAQRAGLDEIEHANLAYTLASAYAGRRFGPGALDLQGLVIASDRRCVLRSLVTEACVGETLGVVEALALAALARDPVLRRAHERIAKDEQRHAELAFRTLAWLLADADDATARFVEQCFDEALKAAALDPLPRALVAPEFGLLSAQALGAIRRQAVVEVIAPCAASLQKRRGDAPAAIATA